MQSFPVRHDAAAVAAAGGLRGAPRCRAGCVSPCAPHLPGGCRPPGQPLPLLGPVAAVPSFAVPAPDMGAGCPAVHRACPGTSAPEGGLNRVATMRAAAVTAAALPTGRATPPGLLRRRVTRLRACVLKSEFD
jgi:hypothetical protein